MTKRNGKPIHGNRFVKSSPDVLALASVVEDKFCGLLNSWLQLKGERLTPPLALNADMLRWRQMHWRHKSGDYRHTEMERRSLEAVAQWTLRMHNQLHGQPEPTWQWEDKS